MTQKWKDTWGLRGGAGTLYPGDIVPTPLPQANTDYVHRDEIHSDPGYSVPPNHWAKGDTLTQATLSCQAKVYTLTYAAAV